MICARVAVKDRIRIVELHAELSAGNKSVSLEQRRRIQLLLFMYNKSMDVTIHKVFPRNTRNSRRIVLKTDAYQNSLYKHSQYFVRTTLWDALPREIIDLPDIYS